MRTSTKRRTVPKRSNPESVSVRRGPQAASSALSQGLESYKVLLVVHRVCLWMWVWVPAIPLMVLLFVTARVFRSASAHRNVALYTESNVSVAQLAVRSVAEVCW